MVGNEIIWTEPGQSQAECRLTAEMSGVFHGSPHEWILKI
jgi:hypothetical protein